MELTMLLAGAEVFLGPGLTPFLAFIKDMPPRPDPDFLGGREADADEALFRNSGNEKKKEVKTKTPIRVKSETPLWAARARCEE